MAKLLSVYTLVMAGIFLFGVFTSFLWSPDAILWSPEIALLDLSRQ